MKIVHLSDLHVSTRSDREYEALRKVVLHVITHHPDAVACITGDFVNNAGSDEFDTITGLLGPLETHCRHVVVCPGNHDVKWLGSFGAVDDGAFLKFRANLTQAHTGFPYVMTFDGVQLIALNSTEETGGWADLARGQIGYRQRMHLAKYLELDPDAHTRVVVLHHHPFDTGVGLELHDSAELLATLAERCDLLLFGHKHRSAIWRGVYGIGWLAASGKTTDDMTYRVFDVQPGKITCTEEKL